jgi:hypothetical protein
MKRLVEKHDAFPPHKRDYLELLEDTNVTGRGKDLIYDADACARLDTMLSETEARDDVEAVFDLLTKGEFCPLEKMQVSCDMEYRVFFEPNSFSNVLLVGSGGYSQIALYVFRYDDEICFGAADICPHATVLCSMLAAKLGYERRLIPITRGAMEIEPEIIQAYDGFFLSSAIKQKNETIERLLLHKRPNAKIYAREDVSHPEFYEPVTISHPDLLTARQAYEKWKTLQEEAV